MARQEGPLQLRGTLENINFYKLGDKYYSRMKGGPSPNRIKSDPEFERTRENSQTFKSAADSGKLLRNAIRPLLKGTAEVRMHNRMLRVLMAIVHGDTTSDRGKQKMSKGPVKLLEEFEFNKRASLSLVFSVPISGNIDKATGSIVLDVPSFVPGEVLTAPLSATHFKLVSAGVALDFDASMYATDIKQSEVMPIKNVLTTAMNIVHYVPSQMNTTMMLIAGVQFLQDVNGIMYPLKNCSTNALKIIKVGV